MAKRMQLMLPFEALEEEIVLSQEGENEKKIVAAMAILLLQILAVEGGKEGEDDLRL